MLKLYSMDQSTQREKLNWVPSLMYLFVIHLSTLTCHVVSDSCAPKGGSVPSRYWRNLWKSSCWIGLRSSVLKGERKNIKIDKWAQNNFSVRRVCYCDIVSKWNFCRTQKWKSKTQLFTCMVVCPRARRSRAPGPCRAWCVRCGCLGMSRSQSGSGESRKDSRGCRSKPEKAFIFYSEFVAFVDGFCTSAVFPIIIMHYWFKQICNN